MTTGWLSTEHLNTIADRLSCDKEDQVNQRRDENKNRANAIINIIEIVPNKVAKVVFYDGTIEKLFVMKTIHLVWKWLLRFVWRKTVRRNRCL